MATLSVIGFCYGDQFMHWKTSIYLTVESFWNLECDEPCLFFMTKSWQKLWSESREVDSREMMTGCWLKDFDWYADDSSSCCCLAPPPAILTKAMVRNSRERTTWCWLKDCTWYADDSSSCCCLASPLANTHLSYGTVKLRAHLYGVLMCGSVSTKGFP